MAGNTSAIQMAPNALILLGHPPISDFNEAGAGAQAASNLYENSYLNLLTSHRWRFATKKARLARLQEKPLNQYDYQFQIPNDSIYIIKVENHYDYEVYEDKLYCNYKDVSIDYMYRVDESMLPPYFAKTFEFFMAAQMAIPVTANSTRASEYNAMYEMQLNRAKYADSTQRPVDIKETSEYIDVRY